MPDEREVERDIDPATGNPVRIVTERIGDAAGDFVITTTHFADGRLKSRTRETFHRPPRDPRARSNLVRRQTSYYAEDGRTIWLEVDERYGNGVNETPLTKMEIEWQVDPVNPEKKWMRFHRDFNWDPTPPPGRWVKHTTVEFNPDGSLLGVTHP